MLPYWSCKSGKCTGAFLPFSERFIHESRYIRSFRPGILFHLREITTFFSKFQNYFFGKSNPPRMIPGNTTEFRIFAFHPETTGNYGKSKLYDRIFTPTGVLPHNPGSICVYTRDICSRLHQRNPCRPSHPSTGRKMHIRLSI